MAFLFLYVLSTLLMASLLCRLSTLSVALQCAEFSFLSACCITPYTVSVPSNYRIPHETTSSPMSRRSPRPFIIEFQETIRLGDDRLDDRLRDDVVSFGDDSSPRRHRRRIVSETMSSHLETIRLGDDRLRDDVVSIW